MWLPAARTDARTTTGAPPAAEERCEAIKAYPGQDDAPESISLSAGEIVFRLKNFGDGWSQVRREHDGTSGHVPTKRLRQVPLPPAEEGEQGSDEEPVAGGGPPPPPEVSDDE